MTPHRGAGADSGPSPSPTGGDMGSRAPTARRPPSVPPPGPATSSGPSSLSSLLTNLPWNSKHLPSPPPPTASPQATATCPQLLPRQENGPCGLPITEAAHSASSCSAVARTADPRLHPHLLLPSVHTFSLRFHKVPDVMAVVH